VVTDRMGQFGSGQPGGIGVALHLAERQRRVGKGAVGEVDRVARVLPPLVGQAVRRGPLVLEVAVAVGVTRAGHPVEGGVDVREQRTTTSRLAPHRQSSPTSIT
jgi:hypothetical protein